MISIWIIIGVLFIHWIADFVLQTDEQAKNKSTSNTALTSHVFMYSLIWSFVSIFWVAFGAGSVWFLVFGPVTFTCHWITDYFTSRLNTRLFKCNKIHEFFVSIGFDQILHYVQLFVLYMILR